MEIPLTIGFKKLKIMIVLLMDIGAWCKVTFHWWGTCGSVSTIFLMGLSGSSLAHLLHPLQMAIICYWTPNQDQNFCSSFHDQIRFSIVMMIWRVLHCPHIITQLWSWPKNYQKRIPTLGLPIGQNRALIGRHFCPVFTSLRILRN